MIACEKVNRKCRMIELDPQYIDVIIKRWQQYTDKQAIHQDTGKSFASLLAQK
jgi:DNA modification methylase